MNKLEMNPLVASDNFSLEKIHSIKSVAILHTWSITITPLSVPGNVMKKLANHFALLKTVVLQITWI